MKGRAYKIARNRGYDRYQRASASMVYKIFDKKARSGVSVNKQLTEENKRKKSIREFGQKILQKIYLGRRFCQNGVIVFEE